MADRSVSPLSPVVLNWGRSRPRWAQALSVRTFNPSARAASVSASLRSAGARHILASMTRAAAIASKRQQVQPQSARQ